MIVSNYIQLAYNAEKEVAATFRIVAWRHTREPDICQACQLMASLSDEQLVTLQPYMKRYTDLSNTLVGGYRMTPAKHTCGGCYSLLQDLHDLWLLVTEADIHWAILSQSADGLGDGELKTACTSLENQTNRQISWLRACIKQGNPI